MLPSSSVHYSNPLSSSVLFHSPTIHNDIYILEQIDRNQLPVALTEPGSSAKSKQDLCLNGQHIQRLQIPFYQKSTAHAQLYALFLFCYGKEAMVVPGIKITETCVISNASLQLRSRLLLHWANPFYVFLESAIRFIIILQRTHPPITTAAAAAAKAMITNYPRYTLLDIKAHGYGKWKCSYCRSISNCKWCHRLPFCSTILPFSNCYYHNYNHCILSIGLQFYLQHISPLRPPELLLLLYIIIILLLLLYYYYLLLYCDITFHFCYNIIPKIHKS